MFVYFMFCEGKAWNRRGRLACLLYEILGWKVGLHFTLTKAKWTKQALKGLLWISGKNYFYKYFSLMKQIVIDCSPGEICHSDCYFQTKVFNPLKPRLSCLIIKFLRLYIISVRAEITDINYKNKLKFIYANSSLICFLNFHQKIH